MISIIMPSYLGNYKHAAKDRDKKILRAVESALNQTVKMELVVISDGCDKTVEILNSRHEGRFNGYQISKAPVWSGVPRNTGIERAKGDIIIYLDVDDYFEPDHCEKIQRKFKGDWCWFDDKVYNKGQWISRKCSIEKRGLCGTSNLAHRKITLWNEHDIYAHDWNFILNLKKASNNYHYIGNMGYRVCHIPGRYDI